MPLLRNPDKSKLSKRKNPVWVGDYKAKGFFAGSDTELFSNHGMGASGRKRNIFGFGDGTGS